MKTPKLIKTYVTVSLLFTCILSQAQQYTTKISALSNEKWWGSIVALGNEMPYKSNTSIEDLSKDNRNNQISPLLLSSSGRYVWSEYPFEFHFEDDTLFIRSESENVKVISGGDNLRDAYISASKLHFVPDGKIPVEDFFKKPQYNTWIELMYNQNQEDIEAYAKNVEKNGFPAGIFMIDDNWQKYYGNFDFKPERFPDPEKMCRRLHKKGFKIMLWISPFVSADTPEYRFAARHDYLVKNKQGEPAIVKWWNGFSACFDLTNPETMDYLENVLRETMKKYGVDGFKFDGGDVTLMAGQADDLVFHDPKATPNEFSKAWAELALRFPYHELRACYKLGGKPLVQRLGDKTYSWNSVGKLIPEMIAAGLVGYPFTCPDMIGGGEFSSFLNIDYEHIDQNLIVRSCQIHAMMPMMQFSVAPWRILDKEHLEICREYARLHKELGPYIIECAKDAAKTGEPIVRHMEYCFPHQGYSQCKDQFMLGDKYMVAPVIDNSYSRNVIIPEGKWKDDKGTIIEGPCQIQIDVPIERLPYYTLLND